jgi:hypothetical protein
MPAFPEIQVGDPLRHEVLAVKSDRCLTDITHAREFYVARRGWLRPRWELRAKYLLKEAHWRFPYSREGWIPDPWDDKLLGEYDNPGRASFALEQVMRMRGNGLLGDRSGAGAVE